MSGSIRWLIGMITLYILLTMLGNTLDQRVDLLSSSDVNIAKSTQNYTTVKTQSTTLGTSGTVGSFLPTTIEGWTTMLTWDYSFWYDYDALGNRTESPLKIIYYIMFVPLAAGMVILLLLVLRQLVLGQ